MADAALTIETASSRLYPAFSIWGISSEPIAATSAVVEPEMPENRISATTVTCASPPRRCPTMAMARSTRRREIPPVSIKAPARMNKGIASKTKLSAPAMSRCGSMRGFGAPRISR